MKSVKNQPIKDAMDTMNEAEGAFFFSEWTGAIFFYILALGKKKFAQIESRKNRTRNVIVGYFLQIFIVALLIYLTYRFWS